MTTNIIEAVQKQLGYPPLKKVDPNIQEIKYNPDQTVEEKLAQSTIPAVLTGFFSLSRSEEGCRTIFSGEKDNDWLSIIFGNERQRAVEKVAQYAGVTVEEAAIDMKQAAREVFLLLKVPGAEKHPEKIRSYMSNQRHNILVHLPATLQLGDLLHDNAMDDRTNKMEGPVSSFMHTIENKLSGGGN